MAQTRSEQRGDKLRGKIQSKLDERATTLGFKLRVADVFQDADDWLHYVIVPESEGVRAYDYAKTLADIEGELRQEGEMEVLLVPAMPD